MFKAGRKIFIGALTLVCLLVWSMLSYPMAVSAKNNGLHLGQLKNKHNNGLHLGQLKDKLKDELKDEPQQNEPQIGQQLFLNIISQAAELLKVEEQTIIDKLLDGNTLIEIAKGYNISEGTILKYLNNKIQEAINDALKAGIITDNQASEMKSNLTENLKQILEYEFYNTEDEDDDEDTDMELAVPVGLTATAVSNTEISLDWDSVSGAASYYVYRAASYSGTYTKIATVTTSNYKDNDLNADTTYYYKIKAHDSTDTSEYSSIVHAITENDTDMDLAAPAGLTAKAMNDTEIFLDWNSVSGATSYYIYRAASYSGTYTRIAIVATSSYTDDDLEADTTYYYKIKAHNNANTSEYSSIVHAVTNDEEGDIYYY